MDGWKDGHTEGKKEVKYQQTVFSKAEFFFKVETSLYGNASRQTNREVNRLIRNKTI